MLAVPLARLRAPGAPGHPSRSSSAGSTPLRIAGSRHTAHVRNCSVTLLAREYCSRACTSRDDTLSVEEEEDDEDDEDDDDDDEDDKEEETSKPSSAVSVWQGKLVEL